MEIRPAEISEILSKQIAAFDTEANVAETGQVLTRRRRHRPRVRPAELHGRRDGRVPRRGPARHGAEPRDRQRRRGDLRRRPADPRGRHRAAHRRHRRRSGGRHAARPRGRCARQSDRRQGPDRHLRTAARRGEGARHHSAQVGARADADRPQGDRRADPDRPRSARADHRRPPDRQDRGDHRHDHQPEDDQRRQRREQEAVLHLCRGRAEAFHRGAACADAGGIRRARLHDRRRRHRVRSRRRCSTSRPIPAAPWASISATTAAMR